MPRGLIPEAFVQQSELVVWADGMSDKYKHDTCAICHEAFSAAVPDICRALDCNHVFHAKCVDLWFIKATFCPLCKSDLKLTYRNTSSQRSLGGYSQTSSHRSLGRVSESSSLRSGQILVGHSNSDPALLRILQENPQALGPFHRGSPPLTPDRQFASTTSLTASYPDLPGGLISSRSERSIGLLSSSSSGALPAVQEVLDEARAGGDDSQRASQTSNPSSPGGTSPHGTPFNLRQILQEQQQQQQRRQQQEDDQDQQAPGGTSLPPDPLRSARHRCLRGGPGPHDQELVQHPLARTLAQLLPRHDGVPPRAPIIARRHSPQFRELRWERGSVSHSSTSPARRNALGLSRLSVRSVSEEAEEFVVAQSLAGDDMSEATVFQSEESGTSKPVDHAAAVAEAPHAVVGSASCQCSSPPAAATPGTPGFAPVWEQRGRIIVARGKRHRVAPCVLPPHGDQRRVGNTLAVSVPETDVVTSPVGGAGLLRSSSLPPTPDETRPPAVDKLSMSTGAVGCSFTPPSSSPSGTSSPRYSHRSSTSGPTGTSVGASTKSNGAASCDGGFTPPVRSVGDVLRANTVPWNSTPGSGPLLLRPFPSA